MSLLMFYKAFPFPCFPCSACLNEKCFVSSVFVSLCLTRDELFRLSTLKLFFFTLCFTLTQHSSHIHLCKHTAFIYLFFFGQILVTFYFLLIVTRFQLLREKKKKIKNRWLPLRYQGYRLYMNVIPVHSWMPKQKDWFHTHARMKLKIAYSN